MKITSEYYSFRAPYRLNLIKNENHKTVITEMPPKPMPSSAFYQDRLLSFGKAGINAKYLENEGFKYLKTVMDNKHLLNGIQSLEELNKAIKDLINDKLISDNAKELIPKLKGFVPTAKVNEADVGKAVNYYGYDFADNLKEIGTDNWVNKHLVDIALLAKSSELNPMERKIVLDLFDNMNFHTAVQGSPVSDGLVKEIAKRKEEGLSVEDYLRYVVKGLVHPVEGKSATGIPPFQSKYITKSKIFDTAHKIVNG
jgi:hypothetical protein